MENKEIFENFYQMIENESQKEKPDINVYRNAYKSLKRALSSLEQTLEYVKDTDKEFLKLYNDVSGSNVAYLIDDLNKLGYAQRDRLGEAFSNVAYRLLEQTRAGKRDEVFHMLLRIHISQKAEISNKLMSVFKQPDDGLFKVLMFSYLSGIIETAKKSPDNE